MAKLLYLGHGSCRLTTNNGKVIYIDPYAGEGYDAPADIVLVTHQHFDHNKLELINLKQNCVTITNKEAIKNGEHQTFVVDNVRIQAVEAYNHNHKISECVGYIVEVDGKKVYFSGDTSKTAMMATFSAQNLDYALLCCDGIYNMGLEEAAECADIIKAKHTIPIHIKPKALFDEDLALRFKAKNKLIVRPNEEIELV